MPRLLSAILLCLCALGVHAQQPSILPQPDLDIWRAGSVVAIAATADGGRIVGGEFQAVGGLPRRHIARLLPDGSVDPIWSVAVDGPINALAVDADGRIYVGGQFANIGGAARNKLARLSANGQLDAGWNPSPSATESANVFALLITGGNLYVAGRFTSIGGQTRSHLAKFATATGAIDPSWAPAADTFSGIRLLAADVQFLYFESTAVFGAPLVRAPLSGNGTIDAAWTPVINNGVQATLADGAGSLYIAGSFTTVQGTPRAGLARLSTNPGAALDPIWNPALDGYADALALDGAGLYVGGRIRSLAGSPRANLARVGLTGSGVADPDFAPQIFGGTVQTLLPGAGGLLHIGGDFNEVAGQPQSALARLSTATATPTAGTAGAELPGSVWAILREPDGSTILGGRFTRVGALARLNLLRLLPEGIVDPAWQANVNGEPVPYRPPPGESSFPFTVAVGALARDVLGRIYVGGTFNKVGGSARANVARLSASGQVDADWNPGADGAVSDIETDTATSVYLAGNFETVGGQPRVSLARLDAAAGAAVYPDWVANLDVGAIATDLLLDGAGSLFVAGNGFQTVNGVVCCAGVLKLAAGGSGARDPTWNVRLGGWGSALALHRGRLYIAGRYQVVNQNNVSHARAGLSRVSAAGSGDLDMEWRPVTNSFDGIGAIAIGTDERIFAAPFFAGSRILEAYSMVGAGSAIGGWQVLGDGAAGPLVTGGGTLLVGGSFSIVNGLTRHGLAEFAVDGLHSDGFE